MARQAVCTTEELEPLGLCVFMVFLFHSHVQCCGFCCCLILQTFLWHIFSISCTIIETKGQGSILRAMRTIMDEVGSGLLKNW